MGTDLDRRGLTTRLPLWSALGVLERPDLVRDIHVDNLRAGADIVTTCTFRTTGRTLAKAGLEPGLAVDLDRRAVELANEARAIAGRADALIAGSIAPLEDCYSPELTPDLTTASREHRSQARSLAAAGVELLMVETMPTVREAVSALAAARETGLDATIGFVCERGSDGWVRLLGGETLSEAVVAVSRLDPAAIVVNCAPAPVIAAALAELRELTDVPLGGYANAGTVDHDRGWAPDPHLNGDAYAIQVAEWLGLGAKIVGGCCGTHAAHVAAVRQMLGAARLPTTTMANTAR